MQRQARFLTGSTMRHVVVMTTTGMLGLTFMFLVDMATLFWVSRIGVEELVAAMGFAWTVQFFMISAGVGLMIAAIALVAKSLGQQKFDQARQQVTASMILTIGVMFICALLLVLFRYPILDLLGATGSTREIAATFLLISVPSVPLMAVGMIGSAVLRAEGDAYRSMMVTTSAGLVAMIVDPFLIFTMDMGVNGAAWGIVISRIMSACLALYYVVRVKDLAAPVAQSPLRPMIAPFAGIALPAVATQMSSPTGNFLATTVIADFGEAAVAGWAVIGRVLVVAFGGVFALSGAIGGIIGQNYGGQRFDRVRSAYKDALIFSTCYVLFTWSLLWLLTPAIIAIFGLSDDASGVVRAFNYIGAGSFVFAGALYVSNAAFNNLGKPLYSTVFNWIKDGVLMWPFCILGASWYAAEGVIYGQSLAWVVGGTVATWVGWRFIKSVEDQNKEEA